MIPSVKEILEGLSTASGPVRAMLVESIYGRSDFTKSDWRQAAQIFDDPGRYERSLGAAYYVLECHGAAHRIVLWEPAISKLAALYNGRDFAKPVWSGSDFVIWWAAKHKRQRPLARKAERIAFEPECASNYRYCLAPLLGMDDFSEVQDEVEKLVLARTDFDEEEFWVADRIVRTYPLRGPFGLCAVHVVANFLPKERLREYTMSLEAEGYEMSWEFKALLNRVEKR